MIETMLQKLGLSKNEIEVYLTVIKSGKISPARISTITGINRTTVYGIGNRLSKLGIIAQDLGKKYHYLTALPPENLENLIKKEEEKLLNKKNIISEAIKNIGPLTSGANYSVPKIQFIEENNLHNHLMKKAKDWLISAEKIDNTGWGYRDHTLLENYMDWIDYYWKVAPKGHYLKLLSNRADVEGSLIGKYPRRHNKYWEKVQNFSVTMWVMGDYVIMVSTRERPHYLIEIHDAVFAKNQRELFKGIWEGLEDLRYK